MVLLVVSLLPCTSQAQFGPAQSIHNGTPDHLRAVDLDGNGDLDLLAVFGGTAFKVFINSDGLGSFDVFPLPPAPNGIALFDVADLDGDGLNDIIYIGNSGSSVRALYNLGSGQFSASTLLFPLGTVPSALRCGDITSNGSPDIVMVIGNGAATDILWSANTGSGFDPPITIPAVYQGDPSNVLLIGDLDEQGGSDLIVQAPMGDLIVLRNTIGDGSVWSPEVILFAPTFPFADPVMMDIDGDGLLDLADASPNAVQWAHSPLAGGGAWTSFTGHVLATGSEAGPGYFGRPGCGNETAVVYAPTDSMLPLLWSGHLESAPGFVQSNDIPGLQKPSLLLLADLDGDGRDDLVKVLDDQIVWRASTLTPPIADPEMPGLDTLCLFGPTIVLPELLPVEGLWSGPGVTGNEFNRFDLFFAGNYTLAYTAYEPQGCPVRGTAVQRVIEGPTVLPDLGVAVCSNDPPINMSSQPTNTIWDGLSNGNILDPAQLTEPYFTCEFEDATGATCVSVIGPIFVWNTLPAEIGPVGPFCVNSGMQTIAPFAAPPLGLTWEGDIAGFGPDGALFNPAIGPGEFELILLVNPTGPQQCANSDTVIVVVSDSIPDVSVQEMPGIYCESGDMIALEGGLPAGGSWSGPGVGDDALDPTVAGAGSHVLVYTYDGGTGCTGSASTELVIAGAAEVFWDVDDLEFCKYDEPAQFTATPPGGAWDAPLDGNGLLSPSMLSTGAYALVYTYTGPDGCTLQNTSYVLSVLPTTDVSIAPLDPLCIDDLPVLVTGSPDGTWSGTFPGQGASVLFDPAMTGIGIWPVTLEAELPGECMGSSTIMVVVRSCAGIEESHAGILATLAPNPFTDATLLTIDVHGVVQLDVFDGTGRTVLQRNVTLNGISSLPLPLHGEANGTYLVRLVHSDQVQYLRAVKAD